MFNEENDFREKKEIIVDPRALPVRGISFTPLGDSCITRQVPIEDGRKSSLKKRKISWQDIMLASEMILKKCRVIAKKSGAYNILAHRIVGKIVLNNQITMDEIRDKYGWLQKDGYEHILNVINDLYELLHGVDRKGIIFTSAILDETNEKDKKLIIRKTTLLVMGRYLSENKIVNIKSEGLLQLEKTLKEIIPSEIEQTSMQKESKAVAFEDILKCKPS